VNLLQLALLADENIHPDVVQWLRSKGCNTQTVCDAGMAGQSDDQILATAAANLQVVLTHDRDFGRLAIAAGRSVYGIVYLRPGHINPAFTVGTVEAIARDGPDLQPPFLLVARRVETMVTMRLRRLPVVDS
jgi:predicted nuclease of predicted toxin-antitoxin system